MRARLGVALAVLVLAGVLYCWTTDPGPARPDGSAERASRQAEDSAAPELAARRGPSPAPASAASGGPALGLDATADGPARAALDASSPDGDGRDGGVTPAQLARIEEWMRENGAAAARSVEAFCADNEQLSRAPLFPESRRARDAATYMAPRIDWESNVRPPGILHLPAPLAEKIASAGQDWVTRLSPADSEGMDFGWLRDLAQFDTWSVADFGPMRDDAPTTFFETPIPNYMPLAGWVKLRLVRALATGDAAAASAEVRHLAALMQTSGLVIGDVMAAHLLQLEGRARASAVERGLPVEAWPPVDTDQAQRLRRVSLSAPFFFAPGVPEPVVKRARGCLVNPCSALAEGLGIQLALAPYAKERNAAAVEEAMRDAPCSPRVFERVRRSKPMDLEAIVRDFSGVSRLPGFYGADGGAH